MRLMIGIPALNEEMTIAEVISQVPATIPGISDVEIVVLDDGSTDRTAYFAERAGADVIRHISNYGVGVAFRSLVQEALQRRVDILVTIDGDGQFRPGDIPCLLEPILNGSAYVCTASRFADPALAPKMPWIKKWGNHRVAALVSSLIGRELNDVSCGFRAYSREALLRLTVYHSFTYTHETLLDLATKRLAIVEVPLIVRGTREYGKSRVASSVFNYGWRTALIMLRFYRDHNPLKLCSYMAVLIALVGIILIVVSLVQLVKTQAWLKWASMGGGALMGLAIGIVFFGFMADMLSRLRLNQEELIYWLRRSVTQTLSEQTDNPHKIADHVNHKESE